MDSLESKDVTTSRGMSYHYYTSPSSAYDASKPAIVLHHGFPDSAHLWTKMVPYLAKLSHRLVIPDLLGYGGTSKPTDPKAYAYHLMAKDVADILDAEDVGKVITIGHDHGAGSAMRFYNHFAERNVALILLNVAYRAPDKSQPFDLDAANALTTKIFGYPLQEYWYFFTQPDAAELMGANLDALWQYANPATPEQMKTAMCEPGAARRAMVDPDALKDFPTKPHAKDEQLKATWKKNLAHGGLEAPLQWYVAMTTNVQFESDKLVVDENIRVNVPFLFIGCEKDMVCRMEMIQRARDAGHLPDFKMEVIKEVGHWPMYEKPEETSGIISRFIEEKGL